MISIIIVTISLILDGVLTNFLSYGVDHLTLFTPLTTLISIISIYPFFYHNEKKYYIISFIIGMIYDLFYTNLLFVDGLIFLFIAYFFSKMHKLTGLNSLWIAVYSLVIIVVYEVLVCFIILGFNLVPISIERVVYKILHSLILNIIYAELVYIITKFLPKKYKKKTIN